MATYNGAQYIEEQLQSFVDQTRQPDEVVVCDDGSTDATLEVVENFKESAPFDFFIYRNEKNLGFIKNFEKAISLCSGDVIFLSDQDDVWFENKIDIVEREFKNSSAMVVINDQVITDSNLKESGATKLDNARRLGYSESWFITGCCTAFRSGWVDLICPIPVEIGSHDIWINRLADMLDLRKIIFTPLQFYRRHETNASESEVSDFRKISRFKLLRTYGLGDATCGWKVKINRINLYSLRLREKSEIFTALVGEERLAWALKSLELERNALSRRVEIVGLPRIVRWWPVLNFWAKGGYAQLSGLQSALKDIIRP